VQPLMPKDIEAAEQEHVVKAPVRERIQQTLQVVKKLIEAQQEHRRVFSESTGCVVWDKGPVH
jgi:hypothetical protein